MKPADPRARREAVEGWLGAADADRKVAVMCIPAGPSLAGVVAFHCRQAVEKLLKGFLTLAGKRGGKTRSLTRLDTTAASFPEIADLVAAATAWSNWAFEFRYPNERGRGRPPPDDEELRRALDVIEALAAHLRAADPEPPGL